MSAPAIDWIWKCPRNGQKPTGRLPPRFSCDCCGASLGAIVVVDVDGKTWGKTCYSRACGHAAPKAAFWTAAEKALWHVDNLPVGTVVTFRNTYQNYTVVETKVVYRGAKNAYPLCILRDESGKVGSWRDISIMHHDADCSWDRKHSA